MKFKRKLIKFLKSHLLQIEICVFLFVVLIFSLKVTNYLHSDVLSPARFINSITSAYDAVSRDIHESKYFGKCSIGTLKIDIGQEYLCRAKTPPSTYQKIYDTYPRDPNGNEVIYPYLDSWSKTTADDFLNNQYDIERYKQTNIVGNPTWTEDPYNDAYWRFNFYSLRIFKDLLDGYESNHNPKYEQKLLSVTTSFLSTGTNQVHGWDDYHAVAWRSMMLTDIWWKLRQDNTLPISVSNGMLASIEQHGNFLLDPNHYESQYNHGTNEAAALYELGVSFPDLPNAGKWRQVGAQRLDIGLSSIIDGNGALIEHSPFYDFYALEKYWDIYQYSIKLNAPISSTYDQRINSMINYATYILQPNLHVPLVGSSLDIQIHDKSEFTLMANQNPEFKYVITKGQSGKKPSKTSIQFSETGQTIMRSGWDANNFTQQTQLIFNYGAYLTHHSHLDALSLQLYSGGTTLLPGPGLYTYDQSALGGYFSGTSSENTVLIDGKNQAQGSGTAGKFVSTKDYTSQSASDQLNEGVTHERQITKIGRKTVVIIDKLNSATTHTYQQLFHLFPGAQYSHNGLFVTAQGKESQQRITITQLASTNGMSLSDTYNDQDPAHPGGLCSIQYNQLLPCHQIAYTQKTQNATYITILQIGKTDSSLSYHLANNGSALELTESGKTYMLGVQETPGTVTQTIASSPKAPVPAESVIDDFSNPANWIVTGGSLGSSGDSFAPGAPAAVLSSKSGQTAVATKNVNLNLVNQNLLFRMKIPSTVSVNDLDILLYSSNGSYVQNRLKNSYDDIHDTDLGQQASPGNSQNNGWTTISLGKGTQRNQQGQWSVYGSNFDWSSVTSIAFRVSSANAGSTNVLLGKISTTPGQTVGKVAMVFDDGTSSILPAVTEMNANGMKGTVAVIGKYPDRVTAGYLSTAQLHDLKDQNWSLVNHSYYHQDAVATYYNKGRLVDFESDILKGAAFLQQNNLNTDANWYIYPHGTTNQAIENIVGKYYKFGRTELTAPEVFPFGNPLAVKDFIVEDSTSPQDVENAIIDAKTYNQTLLLTFHRIHASSTDKAGYDIKNFDQIITFIKQSGIQEMSLNQLDASNGVPINQLHITEGTPSQLNGPITVRSTSIMSWIGKLF